MELGKERRMRKTNEEMRQMCESAVPLLNRSGVVGYVAAYNCRVLNEQIREYVDTRDGALREFGEEVLDEGGNGTGRYTLRIGTPEYEAFVARVDPLAGFEHDVELLTVPRRDAEASGVTGREMLDAAFMFDWGD